MKPVLFLVGCAIALTLVTVQSVLAQNSILATVITISGTVQVLSPPDYQPRSAAVGTSLREGDLIKVQPGSTAVVRCQNSSLTRTIPNDGVAQGIANFCS